MVVKKKRLFGVGGGVRYTLGVEVLGLGGLGGLGVRDWGLGVMSDWVLYGRF